MWDVVYTLEAQREVSALPRREKHAILNAVGKLQALGPMLPFPHQSDVRGVAGIRELRPRAGRSPWRAFYCRVEDTFIIAAIGPEAKVDPRGFDRVTRIALERCAACVPGEDEEDDGGEARNSDTCG